MSTPETGPVPFSRSRRLRQAGVRFVLQACVWAVLSLAIATMLMVGNGPFEWSDALRFSASNWMPWALATPIVFWVSERFPVMRGHLLRSVPVHLVACLICTLGVSWVTQSPALGMGFRTFKLPRPNERNVVFTQAARPGAPSGAVIGSASAFDVTGPAVLGAAGEAEMGGSVLAFNSGGGIVTFSLSAPPPAGFPPDAPKMLFHAPPVRVMSGADASVPPNADRAGVPPAFFSGPMPDLGRPPPLPWQMLLVPLALRANVGFAIYFIVASAAHAMAFYRQAQERKRQSLALTASRNQAKLDALRLQLHPHFLFNTLNAISTLVHLDPDAADKLIGDLSDLLRASLLTTAHEVTLARELELLDHYLAIEQARLGDRLRIVRDIDPVALTGCVPTLILQPLAENAVRHGIEPRLAAGTLTLRARRVGDTLKLTVADDGVGLTAKNPRTSRRGIGIANSEERLRTLHGDRARLDVVSPPDGGVRVEVTLPYRSQPATDALGVETTEQWPPPYARSGSLLPPA